MPDGGYKCVQCGRLFDGLKPLKRHRMRKNCRGNGSAHGDDSSSHSSSFSSSV